MGSKVFKITCANYSIMPWKNGKGVTTQFFIFPPASTLENFTLRLSSASITENSFFSVFPNCDRYLLTMSGNPIALKTAEKMENIEESEEIVLKPLQNVFHFSGDHCTSCKLIEGVNSDEIVDYNVIYHRDKIEVTMEIKVILPNQGVAMTVTGDFCVVYCVPSNRTALDVYLSNKIEFDPIEEHHIKIEPSTHLVFGNSSVSDLKGIANSCKLAHLVSDHECTIILVRGTFKQ